MAIDNEGYTGAWVTKKGRHIFIRDGESIADSLARVRKKNTEKIEELEKEFDKREEKIKSMNPNDKYYDTEKNHLESQQRDLVAEIRELENKIGEYDDEFMSGSPAHDELIWQLEDKKAELKAMNTANKEEKGDISWQKASKFEEKTPYDSKAYAKLLSKSYNAEEEYEDKITPKYIQDIDAGRYGNMSDEEAIKNWIDGGADIIYTQDAENILKSWGISAKNDDAYGTYKDELAKQLTPIYRSDKKNASLSKMSLSELKSMANDYGIETKGLSQKQLIAKLISIFNK